MLKGTSCNEYILYYKGQEVTFFAFSFPFYDSLVKLLCLPLEATQKLLIFTFAAGDCLNSKKEMGKKKRNSGVTSTFYVVGTIIGGELIVDYRLFPAINLFQRAFPFERGGVTGRTKILLQIMVHEFESVYQRGFHLFVVGARRPTDTRTQ